MVLDKSSSKKAFAGKKVRYLSYLLAGALSREGQWAASLYTQREMVGGGTVRGC